MIPGLPTYTAVPGFPPPQKSLIRLLVSECLCTIHIVPATSPSEQNDHWICQEDGQLEVPVPSGQLFLGYIQAPFRTWQVQSLIRLHLQPERNMPEHGRHGKPSIPVVQGNIYNIYMQSSLLLMLCISSTTIATRDNPAPRVNDTSCLRLTNKYS